VSKPDCTCEYCVDDTVLKLKEEVERLKNLLRSIDFDLDEFSCGFCAVPPRADENAVPDAVLNATLNLRKALIHSRLREKR